MIGSRLAASPEYQWIWIRDVTSTNTNGIPNINGDTNGTSNTNGMSNTNGTSNTNHNQDMTKMAWAKGTWGSLGVGG